MSGTADEESRRLALEDFASRTQFTSRRAHLDEAAIEAINALAAGGVDALLLKGAALASALYGTDEQRSYYDIDLLVPPQGLAAAGPILSDLGYRNVSADRGVDDVAGVLHAEVWHRVVTGLGPVAIDLHWRLDGCDAPDDIVWKTMHEAADRIDLAGHAIPTLGRPALALHIALHAAQHGPEDAKSIGDLRRALERWPLGLWQRAATIAERVGAEDAFAGGLRLLPSGNVVADQLGLESAEGVLWGIVNRGTRPRGTFHLDALLEARTRQERMYVIRRALLPSREWITWEMRWAGRSRAQLALGYCLHVLRAPLWTLRALRYRRRERLSSSRRAEY